MADKIGKHHFFKDQEFWACNGLVYVLDYRDECPEDDRFAVCSRMDFACRTIALNNECPHIKYADERNERYDLIEKMVATVKEAKRQGDPFNVEAAKQVAWENRKIIIQNNYDPKKRKRILTGDAMSNYVFDPGIPPIPTNPNGKIAGPDSAPTSFSTNPNFIN